MVARNFFGSKSRLLLSKVVGAVKELLPAKRYTFHKFCQNVNYGRCSILLTIRDKLWRTQNDNYRLTKAIKNEQNWTFLRPGTRHYVAMKSKELTPKQILSVPCTTCGAGVGEALDLHPGPPPPEPHRDRKLSAADTVDTRLDEQ